MGKYGGIQVTNAVGAQKHCSQCWACVLYGLKFLIAGTAIENLCKFGRGAIFVAKDIFEAGRRKDQISQGVDGFAGVQNNAGSVCFHLGVF